MRRKLAKPVDINCAVFCGVTDIAHGFVACDREKICFKRRFEAETSFVYDKLGKAVCGDILRDGKIVHRAVDEKYQVFAIHVQYLAKGVVVSVKETAVATFTVVHVLPIRNVSRKNKRLHSLNPHKILIPQKC